jgi:hypothetical protein
MRSSVLTPLAVAGWVLTSAVSTVSGGPTSPFDLFPRTPAAGIDVKTLAPKLSANAKIYFPGTKEFATYTTRWSNLEAPTPNIVVAPGTENDVQKIVSSATDTLVLKQAISGTKDIFGRSSLRMSITFLSSPTTAIMEPLQPWARWTMVSRFTCLN